MGYISRINEAFMDAPTLPLDKDSKYILFSDCHRGSGNHNDNFLKNQNLYFAALNHYYEMGYHYIELGDGDELWENRCMKQIISIHSNIFWLLSKLYKDNRLHMVYGNHDIIKRKETFTKEACTSFYQPDKRQTIPLLPDVTYHQGLILQNLEENISLYLTHGHQADILNSDLWRLSRFLVRYIWKPMESFGILDPTSAAKNNTKKQKTERKLTHWAKKHKKILVAGHTHRPMLPTAEFPYYVNTGSCVHPRCITGVEITNMCFTLIKWTVSTREDLSLAVAREVLAGPIPIHKCRL